MKNCSELSIIVDTKAVLPQLTQAGRAVALASTHGRPLADVPEQLVPYYGTSETAQRDQRTTNVFVR